MSNQVYEREYVKTGKDAGKPLGEVGGACVCSAPAGLLTLRSVKTLSCWIVAGRWPAGRWEACVCSDAQVCDDC